jgi:hypothetical protein
MKAIIVKRNFQAKLPNDFIQLLELKRHNGLFVKHKQKRRLLYSTTEHFGYYIQSNYYLVNEYFTIDSRNNRIVFTGKPNKIKIIQFLKDLFFPQKYILEYL